MHTKIADFWDRCFSEEFFFFEIKAFKVLLHFFEDVPSENIVTRAHTMKECNENYVVKTK